MGTEISEVIYCYNSFDLFWAICSLTFAFKLDLVVCSDVYRPLRYHLQMPAFDLRSLPSLSLFLRYT